MSQWHASPAQTIYSVMALHAREVSYLFRSSTAKSLKLFFNNLSGPLNKWQPILSIREFTWEARRSVGDLITDSYTS